MITAASAGPGAPFTGVQCPDDGTKAAAADIRRVAATMLANDDYIINDTAGGIASKVSKAGDTMTGKLTITKSGTGDALSATGGSSDGRGAYIKGGSTNGVGADVEGTGTGYGLGALGGSTGFGLIAQAGGGNQPGIKAQGAGTGPDIECLAGAVLFSGTAPAKNVDPGEKRVQALNVSQAHGFITVSGGAATHADGMNVASVAVAAQVIQVTLAGAFANTNYGVTVTNQTSHARICAVDDVSRTTSYFEIVVYDAAGTVIDPALVDMKVAFDAKGRR